MGLREYTAKRDFSRTREPVGKAHATRRQAELGFVIQKHAASHLHYDFRLEMDGVLKSWAVPKGLPTKRGERRLAIQVEDHPLEYGGFEGTIPEGNYGAGTVMVWDMGTYQLLGGTPVEALHSGKLHFVLQGKKLNGEWALVRTRGSTEGAKPQWLLLKTGSDLRPFPKGAEDRSALTRRTLKQIAGAHSKTEWESNRTASRSETAKSKRSSSSRSVSVGVPTKTPNLQGARLPKVKVRFVEPMKALLVDQLPQGPEWTFEVKFDGVRALAIKDTDSVRLVSRAGNELGAKYSMITDALHELQVKQAVLDGELVALDSKGRSSFQLLQSYQSAAGRKPPLIYYVFDVINLEGQDLTSLPLVKRKAVADVLVSKLPSMVRFSSSIQANSARLMREMQARGLEGLVAKKKDSLYEPGRRSGAWVKFKWTNEQEFVIGGYTPPQGGRTHFGAILVGYYKDRRLLFAAKVGTGFNQKLLKELYGRFQNLIRSDCPFANLPENLPGSSKGFTRSKMRECTWLEPKLVCQIRFGEWTRDNHLRQPAFLGLREDKKAEEVVRERPRK